MALPSHQDSNPGGQDPVRVGKLLFKAHLSSKEPVFDVNLRLISLKEKNM